MRPSSISVQLSLLTTVLLPLAFTRSGFFEIWLIVAALAAIAFVWTILDLLNG